MRAEKLDEIQKKRVAGNTGKNQSGIEKESSEKMDQK
jgi:hypothetical protein